jgi:hypothetical protein
MYVLYFNQTKILESETQMIAIEDMDDLDIQDTNLTILTPHKDLIITIKNENNEEIFNYKINYLLEGLEHVKKQLNDNKVMFVHWDPYEELMKCKYSVLKNKNNLYLKTIKIIP